MYKSPFQPIDYEVCFLPYYSESKESKLDNEMSMFSAQLDCHGKKKRIKSKQSLENYLSEKFKLFLQDWSPNNFMNQNGSDNEIGEGIGNLNQSID